MLGGLIAEIFDFLNFSV